MKFPKIGQEPSPELTRVADRVRAVSNALLRVHAGHETALESIEADLEAIRVRLAEIGSTADAPRMVDALDPAETRPYYFPGALAPRAHVGVPWITAEQQDGGRRGRVRFELIHEGPPGWAHGGHVAWFFDQVFGQLIVMGEGGGPTHRLEVVYRKGTPLHKELDYVVRTDRIEGRKHFAEATLHDGETLLAEAKALFVAPKQADTLREEMG